jgi:hypothetical protein
MLSKKVFLAGELNFSAPSVGDDRHHVGLEVAALVKEGADRREVGIGVDMTLRRFQEARP